MRASIAVEVCILKFIFASWPHASFLLVFLKSKRHSDSYNYSNYCKNAKDYDDDNDNFFPGLHVPQVL